MSSDKRFLIYYLIINLTYILKVQIILHYILEPHRDAFTFPEHSMLQIPPGMYFHLIQISDK